MERKVICLLINGSSHGEKDSIIEGVRTSCENMDINLIVLNQMMAKSEVPLYQAEQCVAGELMIFDLIPYEKIDGLIIDSRSFLDDEALKYIIDNAKRNDVPIITLNDERRGCLRLRINDVAGEQLMVEHLIEEHGLSRINFMGGMPGNTETENRLLGYKSALFSHNIEFEEERVAYGLFGNETGKALAKFFESDLEFPQAIVCANDTMAMETIALLLERGYKIPEDVIVVGYDDLDEAQNFFPSVTSVRRGMRDLGETAVKQLYRLWNGKNVPLDFEINPDIHYGHSCGCRVKKDEHIMAMYRFQHDIYQRKLMLSNGISNVTHYSLMADDLDEFLKRNIISTQMFEYYDTYYCMEDVPVTILENAELPIQKMGDITVRGAYGDDEAIGKKVERGTIIPGLDLKSGEGKPFCILANPIYCSGYNLGYIVRKIDKPFHFKGNYKAWLSMISAYLTVYYFGRK